MLTHESYELLIDYYWSQLKRVCLEHDLLPGELLNTRRKSKSITRARQALMMQLRDTVGCRTVGSGRTAHHIFANGVPSDWHRISTTTLGRLIGYADHSATVLALGRERKRLAELREKP